jgi:hypothetical protein
LNKALRKNQSTPGQSSNKAEIPNTTMKIRIIILLIFLVVLNNYSYAQKHADLFVFYQNQQLNKLENRLRELENNKTNDPEIEFFKTIFTDKGENAIKVYEDLLKKSKTPLKNLLAEKISDYYYALGFYVRAGEYKKISQTNFPMQTKVIEKTVDSKNEDNTRDKSKSKYVIQVGAFGVWQNANDLAQFLEKKTIKANVVKRSIGGADLYCVWIPGNDNYDATEGIAKEIKRKYQLSYRIIIP